MCLKLSTILLLLAVAAVTVAHPYHNTIWEYWQRTQPSSQGDQVNDNIASLPFQFARLKHFSTSRKKRKVVDDIALPHNLLSSMQSDVEEKERVDFTGRDTLPLSLFSSDSESNGNELHGRKSADNGQWIWIRFLRNDTLPLFLYKNDIRKDRSDAGQRKRAISLRSIPFSLHRRDSRSEGNGN